MKRITTHNETIEEPEGRSWYIYFPSLALKAMGAFFLLSLSLSFSLYCSHSLALAPTYWGFRPPCSWSSSAINFNLVSEWKKESEQDKERKRETHTHTQNEQEKEERMKSAHTIEERDWAGEEFDEGKRSKLKQWLAWKWISELVCVCVCVCKLVWSPRANEWSWVDCECWRRQQQRQPWNQAEQDRWSPKQQGGRKFGGRESSWRQNWEIIQGLRATLAAAAVD